MQVIYADEKKLKGPHAMNGVINGKRFEVEILPGNDVEVSDKELDYLLKDDSFNFLIEEKIIHIKKGESRKSDIELAVENVEKAEKALELSKSDEEKKTASEALKSANSELAKAEKAAKKAAKKAK